MKFLYSFLLLAGVANGDDCSCPILSRPSYEAKAASARWMTHTMDWGVLSTISTRLEDGPPFGNVYSFVDGPCDESSGTPYFYGSHMDQSFIDTKSNNRVSFTLSEAAFPFTCGATNFKECATNADGGDPENPMCARLSMTGRLVELEPKSKEYKQVQGWLFQRHPAMSGWPDDHEWVIAKLEVEDIWFINFFGGATLMTPEEYFAEQLDFSDIMPASGHTHVSDSSYAFGASFGNMTMLFAIVFGGSLGGSWMAAVWCGRKVSNSVIYAEVKSTDVAQVDE